MDVVLNQNKKQYCQKAKYSTSLNPLPVLACQFFNINYLHTSKTHFFGTVDLLLIVKSDIVIILMKTDKKFFLF